MNRQLFKQIKQILTRKGDPSLLLDRLTHKLADFFVADVCSLYMALADGRMELYSTWGLNEHAKHKTILAKGEGLVGFVVTHKQALAESIAKNNQYFSYRPETKEEEFTSFLGVPVLYENQCIGVLTIQNKKTRLYSKDDNDNLIEIADFLAYKFLKKLKRFQQSDSPNETYYKATSIMGGLAFGNTFRYNPDIALQKKEFMGVEKELNRLETALQKFQLQKNTLTQAIQSQRTKDYHQIIEAYQFLVQDKKWISSLREEIRDSKLSAEDAILHSYVLLYDRFYESQDELIRERAIDIKGVVSQLLRFLGHKMAADYDVLPHNAILIARDIDAPRLLEYKDQHLAGVVLEETSQTSHVAIVARALGIPCIANIKNISLRLANNTPIIMDAYKGLLYVHPSEKTNAHYADLKNVQEKQKTYIEQPNLTKDGVPIKFYVNGALEEDMQYVASQTVEGIGLFRTELYFMLANHLPTLSEQIKYYQGIIDLAAGKPVIFRLLDIGADKILPYSRYKQKENNSALGLRGIRLLLRRPALLSIQIRALINASCGRELRVLLPMVSLAEEFFKVKHIVQKEEYLYYKKTGIQTNVKIGCMIEIPSLVYELDGFAEQCDFFSVGSNDLMQYFFAIDRHKDTPLINREPQYLNISFIRFLQMIVSRSLHYNKSLTLCGEMTTDPLGILVALACGLTSFSFNSHSIQMAKLIILYSEQKLLKNKMDTLVKEKSDEIKKHLEEYYIEMRKNFALYT